jgi:hypothetical protein
MNRMDYGSGGLKISVGNGGRIIRYNSGSAVGGSVPVSKLIFPSK